MELSKEFSLPLSTSCGPLPPENLPIVPADGAGTQDDDDEEEDLPLLPGATSGTDTG